LIPTEWIPTLGVIVVGCLALAGVLRTAQVAQETRRQSAVMGGWEQWRKDAETLRKERDEERDRHSKIIDDTLTEHRRELDAVEKRLDATVAWIRQVIPILREHGIPFPPQPKGITDTDPGLRVYRGSGS
jgi:septal ring factor EnvC (AmiA/AmiB activator)